MGDDRVNRVGPGPRGVGSDAESVSRGDEDVSHEETKGMNINKSR